MKVTPSDLMKLTYNMQQWNKIMEINNRLLNDSLLYLSNLQDVDTSGIVVGDLLQYNTTSGNYEPVNFKDIFTTTTTSTTTSTTSTTTTTP